MKRKIITFTTVLASAMLVMKLNINATTECTTTGGTAPAVIPAVKWVKIDYNAAAYVLPAYQQGINSCILNALSNDSWKNFTRILPYNNPLCTTCNPPQARYGYLQFTITASGYSSNHTIKLDYSNPANSVITYGQTSGTSISGNHLRFQANGEIDIVVPSSIGYNFTATIKSPCGIAGGCDFQNPNNIYVFQNKADNFVTNPAISSLPFDLDRITATYSKGFVDCTIDY